MEKYVDRLSAMPNETMPGTDGIWTFVFVDMSIFLLIFFSYMSERLGQIALYVASQRQINEWFGLCNTLVLLTSSWAIVEAVHAARAGIVERVRRQLAIAWVLGLLFVANKIIEYRIDLLHNITPIANSFFSFYFFITLVHFLHVLVGLLFIGLYWRKGEPEAITRTFVSGLENVALFWHYVDVLWIFIFPLLYLMGRFS